MSILVVEDEDTLAESVRYNLEREGYEVGVVADGRLALDAVERTAPDLIVLDLMLPGVNGLDVLRRVRLNSSVPVVIVTAKDGEADKVAGLEMGADDYVVKPFSMRELISRIRANLRRVGSDARPRIEREDILTGGPVTLHVERHEARIDGELVALRPKEFELLETLLRRRGKLVTRDTLLEEVWGLPFYGDTKTLDVHVRRVRQKIEPIPAEPQWIVTVRGLGYKFADRQAESTA